MKYPYLFSVLVFLTFSCKTDPKAIVKEDSTPSIKQQPRAPDSLYRLYSGTDRVKMDFAQTAEWIAVEKDGKWGIVNFANETIHPIEYDEIITNKMGMVLKEGDRYKFFDEEENRIGISDAEDIQAFGGLHFLARKNNKYALLSRKGSEILPYGFDRISGDGGETIYARKKGIWAAFSLQGRQKDSLSARESEVLSFYQNSRVTLYGVGPIKIGMTQAELLEAVPGLIKGYESESCMNYTTPKDFPTMTMLLEHADNGTWVLERIYVYDRGIATKSDVAMFDSADKLKRTYGQRIESQPNKYAENAIDYFYVPKDKKDKKYRLNFMADEGEIKYFSVGRVPAIFYVEGCL